MAPSVEGLVENCSKLISLPEVAIRVNSMVGDPGVSAAEIGEVISQDPALTTSLLKIANSPLFGLSREVDTVSRAVTVLGGKQIRDLVLASSAADAFKGIPNDMLSMENFWHHSLCCALAAQELAGLSRIRKIESVFIAGLLHDIGLLLIYNKVPELAVESIMLSLDQSKALSLNQAERQVMGFDHAQLGGALIKAWALPESLQACVTFHHEPAAAESHKVEVALTHIANSIAHLIETDSSSLDNIQIIEPAAWLVTGLSEEVIKDVIASVRDKVTEMQAVLKMGG